MLEDIYDSFHIWIKKQALEIYLTKYLTLKIARNFVNYVTHIHFLSYKREYFLSTATLNSFYFFKGFKVVQF